MRTALRRLSRYGGAAQSSGPTRNGSARRRERAFSQFFDSDGHLYFDQSVARESAHADGGAHVPAGLAEDCHQQVRCAIYPLGRIMEPGRSVYIAIQSEDFRDAFE